MESQFPKAERARVLAEHLFALEEPWRGRFLTYIARQANGWFWAGGPPTQEEVTAWLGKGGLYEAATMLLDAWQGARHEVQPGLHV